MEIKPCPFCGSRSVEYDFLQVECRFCHTQGPVVLVSGEMQDFSKRDLAKIKAEAIRLWGERPKMIGLEPNET